MWSRRSAALVLSLWTATATAEEAAPPAPPGPTKGAGDWKDAYLLSRAGAAFADNRFDEAEKLFSALLQQEPNHLIALMHMAAMRTKKNDLQGAWGYLEKAAAAHPDDFGARNEAGNVLLGLRRAQDALPHLLAAAELDPKSVAARVALGDAYAQLGRRLDALRAHRTATEIDPTSLWAKRQLGFDYFELDQPGEALEQFELVAKGDTSADLALVMGHCYSKLGNDNSALRAYELAAARKPGWGAAHLFRGNTLERMQRLDLAQAAYRRAVDAAPKDPLGYIFLGNLLRQQKRSVDARRNYEAALKVSPDNVWALAQLGFLEFELGDTQKAQKHLNRAQSLAPGDLNVALALGDLYSLLKKYSLAREFYEQILEKQPKHLAAMVKLADTYKSTGDLQKARELYVKAGIAHPNSAWAWIALGDCERALGDSATAKARYLAALNVDPGSVWASRQLGYALADLGEDAEARTRLEAALVDDPNQPEVLLALGHIAARVKDYSTARMQYIRASALAPDNSRIRLYIADALTKSGLHADAITVLRDLVSRDGTMAEAWVVLGDALKDFAKGADVNKNDALAMIGEARRAYERAVALAKNNTWAKRQLGFLTYEQGDISVAKDYLLAAQAAYPSDLEVALLVGHVARIEHDNEGAQAAYAISVTLAPPTDLRPAVFSGLAARDRGALAAAREFHEQSVAIDSFSGWAWYELALTQAAQLDTPAAAYSAEQAVVNDPKRPDAWEFFGQMQHRLGNYTGSLSAYAQALALGGEAAPIHLALASVLLDRGLNADIVQAVREVRAALPGLATDPFAQLVAGHVYANVAAKQTAGVNLEGLLAQDDGERRNYKSLAKEHFAKLLELAPSDRALWLSAAYGLADLGEDVLAEAALEPLLKLDRSMCPESAWDFSQRVLKEWTPREAIDADSPEMVQTLTETALLGRAQLLAGQIESRRDAEDAARNHYACAIALEPSMEEAHVLLASAYERAGILELAESHYRYALLLSDQRDVPNPDARLGIERLRKVGGYPVAPYVRVSAQTTYRTEPVNSEVLAREASVLGENTAAAAKQLLTLPRTFEGEATVTFENPRWLRAPRIALSYSAQRRWNAFLSDRLVFEDSRGQRLQLLGAGRRLQDRAGGYELEYEATYTYGWSTLESIREQRHQARIFGLLRRLDLGALYGRAGGDAATFDGDTNDTGALHLRAELGATTTYRPWRTQASLALRTHGVFFQPGNRLTWDHELVASADTRVGRYLIGETLRFALASNYGIDSVSVAGLGSIGIEGRAGIAVGRSLLAIARFGFQGVPSRQNFDTVRVGGEVGYRFFTSPILAQADVGFGVKLAYEFRYAYWVGRLDHVVLANAGFGL